MATKKPKKIKLLKPKKKLPDLSKFVKSTSLQQETKIDHIHWSLVHTLELEHEVLDYIKESRRSGSSWDYIEQSLTNSGVPEPVILKCMNQARNSRMLLVSRAALYSLIVLALTFLITTVVLLTIDNVNPECITDAQCQQGFQCIQGDCIDFTDVFECEQFIESDGSRTDAYYRCVAFQ